MWMQCEPGKCYKNPTWGGKDWYLRMSDDGMELVAKKMLKREIELMIGPWVRTIGGMLRDDRVFVHGGLMKANVWSVEVLSMPPEPTGWDAISNEPIGVLWEMDMYIDMVDLLKKKPPELVKLLGTDKVIESIKKQYRKLGNAFTGTVKIRRAVPFKE